MCATPRFGGPHLAVQFRLENELSSFTCNSCIAKVASDNVKNPKATLQELKEQQTHAEKLFEDISSKYKVFREKYWDNWKNIAKKATGQ